MLKICKKLTCQVGCKLVIYPVLDTCMSDLPAIDDIRKNVASHLKTVVNENLCSKCSGYCFTLLKHGVTISSKSWRTKTYQKAKPLLITKPTEKVCNRYMRQQDHLLHYYITECKKKNAFASISKLCGGWRYKILNGKFRNDSPSNNSKVSK